MLAGALIDKENIFMKAVGVGALVFGSTTLFFQLQHTLNALWDVESAPKSFTQIFIRQSQFLRNDSYSCFLLMITMVLSSLSVFSTRLITQYFGLKPICLLSSSIFRSDLDWSCFYLL
jgi:membrane protein